MATTPEEEKQARADFAAAYDEDVAPAPEQTEDEAFGIAPEAPAADAQPGDAAPGAITRSEPGTPPGQPEGADKAAAPADAGAAPPAVESDTAAAGEPAGQTAAEAAGDAPGEPEAPARIDSDTPAAPAAGEPSVEEPSDDPVKERQRLKSWEGRLRKIEAELKAKADAAAAASPAEAKGPAAEGTSESTTADALDQVADAAGSENPALAAEAAEVSERVESGEISPEDALKQLAEDFGEDFVKMIESVARSIATKVAGEAAGAKVGELGKSVDDIIAHISDGQAKAHFKEIAAAHPDFRDIGKSEGFAEFVNAQPDPEAAKRVVQSGSADEIVKLLDAYKASQKSATPEEVAQDAAPAADPVVDEATNSQMDAAEGVRSSGMQLPAEPKKSASYEDAWNEFAG